MILVGEHEHSCSADEEDIVKRAAIARRKTRVLDALLDEDDSDKICILCVLVQSQSCRVLLKRIIER